MTNEFLTVGGLLAVLTALGAAIKWVWGAWVGRLDRREQLLEAAEQRQREYADQQFAEMRQELADMKRELADLRDVANRQWAVIHMLVAKIHPDDPVLKAAELFLGRKIFSVSSSPELDAMARELADKIGEAE